MSNIINVDGKNVLVTGAHGQLGTKTCKLFSDDGANVIPYDLKDFDLRNRDEVYSNYKKAFDEFGTVDILINNAGISTFAHFLERSEEDFNDVSDVNLAGTFNSIQTYVKLCDEFKQKKGTIVNIASIYGIISPDPRIYTDCKRSNSEIYGATKAGLIQMTKYFAVHLAERNIRVNAVSPGGIYNPKRPQGEDFLKQYSFRCPMKRMANDEEIVTSMIYLASDAASYVTGQNIVVDGGMSCW